jgi:RNA recognition motif-containing protein
MNIFVTNLDGTVTINDLRRAFSGYGTIVDVTVMIDKATGKPLGKGQIHLVPERAAREAMEELHLAPLRGRPIKIRECIYRAKRDRRAGRAQGHTLERRRASDRRFTGVNPLNPSGNS